jgi:hypothetical protein
MANPTDRLATFLYVLMRDHLPVGAVHSIIANHINDGEPVRPVYSDKNLAAIAQQVAATLVATDTPSTPRDQS